jgi:hypothetical protein
MLRTDSGPGRNAASFLTCSYVEGVICFPGLPNGTECTQEMDAIFAAFKIQVMLPQQSRQVLLCSL